MIKKNIENSNVILLANKTDLKFTTTKYKIEEFARNNFMRVYECGQHKSAGSVFENMIVDYYLDS